MHLYCQLLHLGKRVLCQHHPLKARLQVGQHVFQGTGPPLVLVKHEFDAAPPNLVPLNRIGQLKYLPVPAHAISLRRKLCKLLIVRHMECGPTHPDIPHLDACKEANHGAVVACAIELGNRAKQVVSCFFVCHPRVAAHWHQSVRKAELAGLCNRAQQQHSLTPRGVDLIPLNVDVGGASQPKAADSSKPAIVPAQWRIRQVVCASQC